MAWHVLFWKLWYEVRTSYSYMYHFEPDRQDEDGSGLRVACTHDCIEFGHPVKMFSHRKAWADSIWMLVMNPPKAPQRHGSLPPEKLNQPPQRLAGRLLIDIDQGRLQPYPFSPG